MTRLEENYKIINEMAKRVRQHPDGTYQEIVTFQLDLIITTLVDISKSLAILADKIERDKV